MEFCSERELQNQTGHSVYEWPTVICKELVDNALDACEEGEVAPEIAIAVEKDTIVVQDNAGGIDAATIESSTFLSAQPHHVLLNGNLFPGHESSPSLDRDSTDSHNAIKRLSLIHI